MVAAVQLACRNFDASKSRQDERNASPDVCSSSATAPLHATFDVPFQSNWFGNARALSPQREQHNDPVLLRCVFSGARLTLNRHGWKKATRTRYPTERLPL